MTHPRSENTHPEERHSPDVDPSTGQPLSGDPSFFDGLGADDAHLRDTMARFHTDLAQTSQTQANIAGQQINDFGYQSLSYSRASTQAAADAAQARQQAEATKRYAENAERLLAESRRYEEQARRHDLAALKWEREDPDFVQEWGGLDLADVDRRSAAKARVNADEARELAQKELNKVETAPEEERRLITQAEELDSRSRQLTEQAQQARSHARTLLGQQTSAIDQHDQSQQRAQTYQRHGAGRLVYDHAGIEAAIAELQQILDRAQTKLENCRQARQWLQQNATGAAADASQERFLQLEQINQHIIETVRKALRDLGVNNDDMAHLEQRNAAQYHW